MTQKPFLISSLTIFLVLVLLCTIINVLVDPYGLFEIWRNQGVNEIKPMAGTRVQATKPYQLARARPKTLIAGNSRPELGIDPASECWTSDDRPVFNASMPGVRIYDQARMIQSAIQGGTVMRLLWGLDFIDFVSNEHRMDARWPLPGSAIDKRLPTTASGLKNPDYAWYSLLGMRDAALSLDAMRDSIFTVLQQGDAYSSTRRSDGFNPARDYIGIINTEGQGVLFRQKNSEIIRRLSLPGLALYAPGDNWSREFESVQFILHLAEQAGIETSLFINPYHADYMTAIDVTGKWPLFEAWKRHLTILVSTSERATIWDFNAFDRYSIAPPPDYLALGNVLKWYWEPAHYRAELGNLIVARMRDMPCPENDSSFGSPLYPHNIESHLLKLRTQMNSYQKQFADRVAMLKALVNKVAY